MTAPTSHPARMDGTAPAPPLRVHAVSADAHAGVVGRVLRWAIGEVRDLAAGYHGFFFAPSAPHALCVLRILAGGMMLYSAAVWGLALESFFGPGGYQPADLVREHAGGGPSLWHLVPAGLLWPAHVAFLAVLACFTAGLGTRVTGPLAFLVTTAYSQRVPMATFGLDQLCAFLALYLAVSPCGAVLSADRAIAVWRAKRAGRPVPAVRPSSRATLGTRLIQLHLCVVYTAAGLAKLKGVGWWDGTAVWGAAANLEYQSGSLLWLADFPALTALFTHATVVWELTFWALVWRPRLRPYVLLVGAGMHVGIGLFLGMWTFGLVMCFAYVAFVPPAWVARAIAAARGRLASPADPARPAEPAAAA